MIWNIFLEIWRFEKHIALSEKKPPLISHFIRGYQVPVQPYRIHTLHKCFFLSRSLCGGSGRPASGLKSLDKSPFFYAIFLDEETFLQSGG